MLMPGRHQRLLKWRDSHTLLQVGRGLNQRLQNFSVLVPCYLVSVPERNRYLVTKFNRRRSRSGRRTMRGGRGQQQFCC
jgi:hypothetical protein